MSRKNEKVFFKSSSSDNPLRTRISRPAATCRCVLDMFASASITGSEGDCSTGSGDGGGAGGEVKGAGGVDAWCNLRIRGGKNELKTSAAYLSAEDVVEPPAAVVTVTVVSAVVVAADRGGCCTCAGSLSLVIPPPAAAAAAAAAASGAAAVEYTATKSMPI